METSLTDTPIQPNLKYNAVEILKKQAKQISGWELDDFMVACRGNIAEASRALRVSRSTLRKWIVTKKRVLILYIEGRFNAYPEASYKTTKEP